MAHPPQRHIERLRIATQFLHILATALHLLGWDKDNCYGTSDPARQRRYWATGATCFRPLSARIRLLRIGLSSGCRISLGVLTAD